MVSVLEQPALQANRLPGYRFAGKTGTADFPTNLGYTSGKTYASIVSFGPLPESALFRVDPPRRARGHLRRRRCRASFEARQPGAAGLLPLADEQPGRNSSTVSDLPRLSLGEVLTATGGQLQGSASPSQVLSGVSHDSRDIQRGGLFVALRGPKHDGHSYVAEAFARGASAALVERIPTEEVFPAEGLGPPLVQVGDTTAALRDLASFWVRRQHLSITYVVGSIGRTTTSELIAAVLRQRSAAAAISAGSQPEVGVPLALLGISSTVAQVVLELGALSRLPSSGP